MTLINRLQLLNQRLQTLPARLGVPQYLPVTVQQGSTFIPLGTVKVSQVTERDVINWGNAGVDITLEDVVITVPRTFSYDTIRRGVYLINASENSPGTWLGVRTIVKHVDTNDVLNYTVLAVKNTPR